MCIRDSLSTDVGHMSNILPNELLAKKNDKESLKELLEAHIDNIELMNQEAIFEYITNDYSIEKKVSEIIRCYEDLFNSWLYKFSVLFIILSDV